MKPYPWIVLIFLAEMVQAQSVSTLMGARPAGMGNASAVIQDESSLFNNIGAMARVDKTSLLSAYESSPALTGASRTAAGILVPAIGGVFGAGLFRFGDDLYSEQTVKVAYSNHFGIASLGASIQYAQYQAQAYDTKGAFSMNFGGLAQISPHVSVGAFITNLTQAGLSSEELLPVKLTAGIGFKPDEWFVITTEVEKDLAYQATWKTGAEYVIRKKIFVRSGFNLHPNAAFFGLGFKSARWKADYAIGFNSMIGNSHQASATLFIDDKKKKK